MSDKSDSEVHILTMREEILYRMKQLTSLGYGEFPEAEQWSNQNDERHLLELTRLLGGATEADVHGLHEVRVTGSALPASSRACTVHRWNHGTGNAGCV